MPSVRLQSNADTGPLFHRAGLVGAGAYAILTTSLHVSPRNALLVFSFLPAIMLLSFFAILPHGPLRLSSANHQGVEEEDTFDPDEETEPRSEHERLLASSMHSASGRSFTSVQSTTSGKDLSSAIVGFKANLRRAKGLFIP